jgi:hypothetical protein
VNVDVFSESFDDQGAIAVLRAFEAPLFDQILKLFHAGVRTGVDAQSRPRGQPYKPVKASDLPRQPISKDEADKALGDLDKALADNAMLSALYGGADAELVRSVLDPLLDKIRGFIRRCAEIGPAAAYAEFIGVDVAALSNKRMDRTVQESVFRSEVRRVAAWLFKDFAPNVASHMAESVALTDCPGQWLARELELEIRAAEPEQDPSNVYDVDHVTYFPYVEAFFADKRIGEYVRRILKRESGPVVASPSQGPHSTAHSVAALQEALAALP